MSLTDMRKDILCLIRKYSELNSVYLSSFDLTEDEEDSMLKNLWGLEDKIVDLLFTFCKGKIDKSTLKLMLMAEPERNKLIAILS